jgi:hypothetical protein
MNLRPQPQRGLVPSQDAGSSIAVKRTTKHQRRLQLCAAAAAAPQLQLKPHPLLLLLLLLLLQEVGADGFNTALCLTGKPVAKGRTEPTPACKPSSTTT